VGGGDHCCAFGRGFGDQAPDQVKPLEILVGRGLVGEEEGWATDQGTANGCPLLFSQRGSPMRLKDRALLGPAS
jgi:hypothetical protein